LYFERKDAKQAKKQYNNVLIMNPMMNLIVII
jgi:hypothetical protein